MDAMPRSLAEFTALARERALTDDETSVLDRLLRNERDRQRNLPLRILKLRANLRALEAQLSPNQARWLGSMQESADARRAANIEREMRREIRRRVTRIERELGGVHPVQPPKGETEND